MTIIDYDYEILSVGENSMEVKYTNPAYGSMIVGTRRPLVGEDIDQVVAEASPAVGWNLLTIPKAEVVIGKVGKGSTRVSPDPVVEPTPEESLAIERRNMHCSAMQGKLVLGKDNWQKVLDYRDNTGDWVVSETVQPTSWAEQTIIDSAQTWERNSQNIQFFQFLMGLTDEDVDHYFRAASLIDA